MMTLVARSYASWHLNCKSKQQFMHVGCSCIKLSVLYFFCSEFRKRGGKRFFAFSEPSELKVS